MPRAIERALERWTMRRDRFSRILRAVLGFPDYAAYLEHCRRAGHEPVCDERQFIREYFESRGKTTRCC